MNLEKDIEHWNLSSTMEAKFEWKKWIEEIPYLEFPKGWLVKAVPPFGCAVVRYHVTTAKLKGKDRISIYLDCYDYLGYFKEPYWEVYPVSDDTERFRMNDTDGLIKSIAKALEQMEK
jgi:hypothetical protein